MLFRRIADEEKEQRAVRQIHENVVVHKFGHGSDQEVENRGGSLFGGKIEEDGDGPYEIPIKNKDVQKKEPSNTKGDMDHDTRPLGATILKFE